MLGSNNILSYEKENFNNSEQPQPENLKITTENKPNYNETDSNFQKENNENNSVKKEEISFHEKKEVFDHDEIAFDFTSVISKTKSLFKSFKENKEKSQPASTFNKTSEENLEKVDLSLSNSPKENFESKNQENDNFDFDFNFSEMKKKTKKFIKKLRKK